MSAATMEVSRGSQDQKSHLPCRGMKGEVWEDRRWHVGEWKTGNESREDWQPLLNAPLVSH